MKLHISLKYVNPEDKHGEWETIQEMPSLVLLETEDSEVLIKFNSETFWLREPLDLAKNPDSNKEKIADYTQKYRVLPKNAIVVCEQE